MTEKIAQNLDECHHHYIVSEIKQYLSTNENLQGINDCIGPQNLSKARGIYVGFLAPIDREHAKIWALKGVNCLLKNVHCKESTFYLTVATYYLLGSGFEPRRVNHVIYLQETVQLKDNLNDQEF
jgi:hypothetical protein